MSVSDSNFNGLLDIDKDDILVAMKKLTKIIQSEKQFDVTPYQQPSQHFSSPAKIHTRNVQRVVSPPQDDYFNEAELLQSLKSVAHELSNLDAKPSHAVEHSESEMESERHQESQGEEYISYENEKEYDRCNTTINRLYELDSRKKEKIAALQFQRYKEELATMRAKPEISLNSKIIAEQKHKAPIYERAHVIMKQREENINKMRRELEQTKLVVESSPTFQPDLSYTKRFNYEKTRTPREFTAQVYAWQHKKNENIQKEQYDNITRELAELTFKPKINHKSRHLADKGNSRESVEDRLYKYKDQIEEKRSKLIEKEKPSFSPILNEKSQNLMKNRKANDEKTHRRDKSVSSSFVNLSQMTENTRKGPSTQGRSLTPTPFHKAKKSYDRSIVDQKLSPKFNEVNYTPAVEFLLKKFD